MRVQLSCPYTGDLDPPSPDFDPGGGDADSTPCVHFSGASPPLAIHSATSSCGVCREESRSRSGGAGDGSSSPTWFCLTCSNWFCGGSKDRPEPYGHSRRHARVEHHPLAVRSSDLRCWCFECKLFFTIQSLVDNPQRQGIRVGNPMSEGRAVRGLVNLGNTCFFNAVLQNLLAIDSLREYLTSSDRPRHLPPIASELRKLFVATSRPEEESGSTIAPRDLFDLICMNVPRFSELEQQDSHELLSYLLNGLHDEEINREVLPGRDEADVRHLSPSNTMVNILFQGQLSSILTCVECGHSSVVFESFLHISLPLPSKKRTKKNLCRKGKKNSLTPVKAKGRLFYPEEVDAEIPLEVDSEKSRSFTPQSDCDETVDLSAGKFVPMAVEYATVLDGTESGLMVHSGSVIKDSADHNFSSLGSDYARNQCRDESGSSCIQDSDLPSVRSLINTELGLKFDILKKTGSVFQNAPNDIASNNVAKEPSGKPASVIGCEAAKICTGGSGGLYNDTEITSNMKEDAEMAKQADTIIFAGNSSGSNEDEVDSGSSLASIDSCLALFTKPELLSHDHGWYCENCSQILPHGGLDGGKLARLDHSETLKFNLGGDEVICPVNYPNMEVDFKNSFGVEVIAEMNTTVTSSKILKTNDDKLNKTNTNMNCSMGQSCSEGLICSTGEAGEAKHGEKLDVHGNVMDDGACFASFVQKDECLVDSDNSQYESCPSNTGVLNLLTRVDTQDDDSCSSTEVNFSGCIYQDQETAFHSSPGNTETNLQSSCDNDIASGVNQLENNQGEEKYWQLSQLVHLAGMREVKTEFHNYRKIKRDVTKTFCISRLPQILIIHLKRFSQGGQGRINKLRGHVSVQEVLDLKLYVDMSLKEEDCKYHLTGIVEHLGSMRGGHYVAYVRGKKCRDKVDKDAIHSWYHASDSQVKEVSVSQVLQCEAYLLFYERVQSSGMLHRLGIAQSMEGLG